MPYYALCRASPSGVRCSLHRAGTPARYAQAHLPLTLQHMLYSCSRHLHLGPRHGHGPWPYMRGGVSGLSDVYRGGEVQAWVSQ